MSPALIHLRWRAKLVKLEISMLVSQGCENCWQNLERMIEHYLGIILGIGWHFPHPSPWCTLSQIKSQDLHNNIDTRSLPCIVPTYCGIWTPKCELPWFCAEDFVNLWTSQHSGSCGTISVPNITHFWPHWEWRNTPRRELDVFSQVAQSLQCVRQVSFPQPLPISLYPLMMSTKEFYSSDIIWCFFPLPCHIFSWDWLPFFDKYFRIFFLQGGWDNG